MHGNAGKKRNGRKSEPNTADINLLQRAKLRIGNADEELCRDRHRRVAPLSWSRYS
mgnify:CR=1 FL=1